MLLFHCKSKLLSNIKLHYVNLSQYLIILCKYIWIKKHLNEVFVLFFHYHLLFTLEAVWRLNGRVSEYTMRCGGGAASKRCRCVVIYRNICGMYTAAPHRACNHPPRRCGEVWMCCDIVSAPVFLCHKEGHTLLRRVGRYCNVPT